jgi:hypothetical protein
VTRNHFVEHQFGNWIDEDDGDPKRQGLPERDRTVSKRVDGKYLQEFRKDTTQP